MVRPNRRYINIGIAIIVIVPDRAPHPIHFDREPRSARHLRKRAIVIVVMQRRKRFAILMLRPIPGVHEQNVLPPVIVVVQKTDSTAHRFRQILFSKGSAVMPEMNGGPLSNVRELYGS